MNMTIILHTEEQRTLGHSLLSRNPSKLSRYDLTLVSLLNKAFLVGFCGYSNKL